MKRILVLIAIGACFNVFSQNNSKEPSKDESRVAPKTYVIDPNQLSFMIDGKVVNFSKESNLVSDLSLSNLPCRLGVPYDYVLPEVRPGIVYSFPNPAFPMAVSEHIFQFQIRPCSFSDLSDFYKYLIAQDVIDRIRDATQLLTPFGSLEDHHQKLVGDLTGAWEANYSK